MKSVNYFCHFDETMFSNVGDTDKVALVIKNYGKVGGMSQFVHSQLLIDKFVKKDSD